MNIKEHIRALKAERGDISYAFLAERTETTPDSPYRIKPADKINPEETLVLVFAGSGGQGDNIRGYNGYLKKTDEFIKNHSELKDKPVRVCVAVCNFGKYHNDKNARHYENWRLSDYKYYEKCTAKLEGIHRQEILDPQYIKDIFDIAILPRISSDNGKSRLNQAQAVCNIRKLNLVTHCHGAYIAMKLERLMNIKMKELGYSPAEQRQIKKNLLSVNYAPNCMSSLGTDTTFVAVESAMDGHNELKTYPKEYLHMVHKDFGVCCISEYNIKTLMCAQVDKAGIEGNPPYQWIVRKIDEDDGFFAEGANASFLQKVDEKVDIFAEIAKARREAELNDYKEPEDDNRLDEHSFIGFVPKAEMSRGAMQMQQFANNLLKNAVKNSLAQTKEKYIPLPPIHNLCADTFKEKCKFAKAAITGFRLLAQMKTCSLKKIDAHGYARRNSYVTLD